MAAAETYLYLTTVGRRSGLPRDIEIWFVEHAGRYYLVSEHRERSNWVRNLRANPRVELSIGTRDDRGATRPRGPARARIVEPDAEPALATAVRALMAAKYDWSDGTIVELMPG